MQWEAKFYKYSVGIRYNIPADNTEYQENFLRTWGNITL